MSLKDAMSKREEYHARVRKALEGIPLERQREIILSWLSFDLLEQMLSVLENQDD